LPTSTVERARGVGDHARNRCGSPEKWFNLLYLTVTEHVLADLNSGQWEDLNWLNAIDAVFGDLYFDAIRAAIDNMDRLPHAWRPLFEGRQNRRLARVQFALAGMNAHINRDLCHSLVRMASSRNSFPKRSSGVYKDFCRVNLILERAEAKALEFLSTGLVGLVDEALGDIDNILAMWSVKRAREAAWVSAEVLWYLRRSPFLAEQYSARLDRVTGFAGRGLLQPLLRAASLSRGAIAD